MNNDVGMPAILGAAGVGLVWGWLLALRRPPWRRPAAQTVALIAASAIAALTVIWLADWYGVIAFAVATVLGLGLHGAWLAGLHRRFRAR
jgi:hypothetical protein